MADNLLNNFFSSITWDISRPTTEIYVYNNIEIKGDGSIYEIPSNNKEVVTIYSSKAPGFIKEALTTKFDKIPDKMSIPVLPYRDPHPIPCEFKERFTVQEFIDTLYNIYQKEISQEDINLILSTCDADNNGYKYLRDHISELQRNGEKIKLLDFLITNSGKSYTKFYDLNYTTEHWELLLTLC